MAKMTLTQCTVDTLLGRIEREGSIRFVPRGPKGAAMAMTLISIAGIAHKDDGEAIVFASVEHFRRKLEKQGILVLDYQNPAVKALELEGNYCEIKMGKAHLATKRRAA